MTEQHPITPSPELIEEWIELSRPTPVSYSNPNVLATHAARWGADQELEACCKWLPKLPPWSADDLRKHRRPKPQSLKEESYPPRPSHLSITDMATITTEQQQAIATVLAPMTLSKGLGTAENACSIAAINLALTGELTDEIPDCMSEVIGRWIIGVQDAMPAQMRNSAEWKRLLPLAAGTGRRHEKERLEVILDWMWSTVLPTLQPIADEQGFGEEWHMMLQQRTAAAANHAAARAVAAYTAADAAARAANSVRAVAAYTAADAAANHAAARAAARAVAAYTAADAAAAWQQFNPCGLLQRLIEEGVTNP